MKSTETLRHIKKGANLGMTFGIVFAITGGVSTALGANSIAESDATVVGVVALYLLGGPLVGAGAGAMWRLTGTVWGSSLAGVILCVPFSAGAMLVLLNFSWEPAATFSTLVGGSILGAIVGAIMHGIFAPRPKGSKGLRKTRR